MQMNKYAKIKNAMPLRSAIMPSMSPIFRGKKRDNSSTRYDDLKNSPKSILESKKLAPRQKLQALVAHYEKPGIAPPNKNVIKQLKKTDFSGVNARGINLRALGERAVGAINWIGADLSGQDFSNFKMPKINLRSATLMNTRFDGCDVQNADMENARTGATSFVNADMRGANTNAMTGVVVVANAALWGKTGIENLTGSSGGAHTDNSTKATGDPTRGINPALRRTPAPNMTLVPR